MNTLPPAPGRPPLASPDVRNRYLAPDFAGMDDLVADLVLPVHAPAHVLSALETARELLRHSYFRYEFATVAAAHALFAVEQALGERLGVEEPLGRLIELSPVAGLLPAELAERLDRSRQLRDRLSHGTATSGVLRPQRAVVLVRAAFDAAALLFPPPPPAPAADRSAGLLGRLWEEHRRTPFPESFRGVDVGGEDLVLLDADVAGLVLRELTGGGLDGDGLAILWRCLTALDAVLPSLGEAYCTSYCTRLRTIARLAAARHLPDAS
ncbi:hypothetical protein [Kitasatospora sp. LaBMicrA B282]|uniref:hypothetical protein n=1 Tax=Kitasatospora sp. LaBMicrA B282 TaxID=3420949 RepID=UPI003D14DFA1